MPNYQLKINGKSYDANVAEDTPLLWVLRDHLGLVGTKYGCGIASCGACTVHVNGTATRSCIMPVSGLQNAEIVTIEGLSENGDHPVQQAWEEVDVAQCGYCQNGQIMTAKALLDRNPNPSDAEIRAAMDGALCRCMTYYWVQAAIKRVARGTKAAGEGK